MASSMATDDTPTRNIALLIDADNASWHAIDPVLTVLAELGTVNIRRVEFLNATANPIDIEILGRDGRATILREVAKGLQMPVDEVIPSREKAAQQGRVQAAAMAQQQQAAPTPTAPDGSPMGGMDGNTVSNRVSGRAA